MIIHSFVTAVNIVCFITVITATGNGNTAVNYVSAIAVTSRNNLMLRWITRIQISKLAKLFLSPIPPLSDAGTGEAMGATGPPQYLADQLTLFQPGVGRLCPPLPLAPQSFSPSGITDMDSLHFVKAQSMLTLLTAICKSM